VLRRLSALPIDTFLLAMAATVALAAVLPARGAFADAMSVAAKVVIALLFALYGARLSPQQAWHGVKQWQLHLLVLATTFVVFPVLGLAARGLVPWLLTCTTACCSCVWSRRPCSPPSRSHRLRGAMSRRRSSVRRCRTSSGWR